MTGPTANAACASAWGAGSGGNCITTFGGVAVALDDTSTASATGGLFNTAIAGGGSAKATAAGPGLNTAIALGERADATAVGTR